LGTPFTNQELEAALTDLKLDEASRKAAAAYYEQGQTDAFVRLLTRHRTALLADVHEGRERLYELDYILQKAKR
jgi:hypothetical protein